MIYNFINDYINVPYPFNHYVKLVHLVLLGDTVHVGMHVSPYFICHVLGYLEVSDIAIVALMYVQLWYIIAGKVGAVV